MSLRRVDSIIYGQDGGIIKAHTLETDQGFVEVTAEIGGNKIVLVAHNDGSLGLEVDRKGETVHKWAGSFAAGDTK